MLTKTDNSGELRLATPADLAEQVPEGVARLAVMLQHPAPQAAARVPQVGGLLVQATSWGVLQNLGLVP